MFTRYMYCLHVEGLMKRKMERSVLWGSSIEPYGIKMAKGEGSKMSKGNTATVLSFHTLHKPNSVIYKITRKYVKLIYFIRCLEVLGILYNDWFHNLPTNCLLNLYIPWFEQLNLYVHFYSYIIQIQYNIQV